MKVFISWSGDASRGVAEALAEWIPKVLQGVQPFISSKDLDKGSNWTVELARELEHAQFGIVCLTQANLTSPWLHYEAGAITKSVDSRVCPVLHGVAKHEIAHPFAQLQLTETNQEDFKALLNSMNKTAGNLVDRTTVDEAVDVWWEQLSSKLAAIGPDTDTPTVDAQEPDRPEPRSNEMFAEILGHLRDVEFRMTRLEGLNLGNNPKRELNRDTPNDDAYYRNFVGTDPSTAIVAALEEQDIHVTRIDVDSGTFRVTIDPINPNHYNAKRLNERMLDISERFSIRILLYTPEGEITSMTWPH